MFVLDGTSIRQGAGDKKDGKTKIMPKISFIIASVDRDRQLEECISSIEKAHEYNQDIPIEILVIIQKAKQNLGLKGEVLLIYAHKEDLGRYFRNLADVKTLKVDNLNVFPLLKAGSLFITQAALLQITNKEVKNGI